jgi:alkylation response protein AidB-like acyl-CoA dehydrogenase
VEFDLTEDQHEIKDVAKALLAARSPFANVRHAAEAKSYQEELSSELLSLGWPGIAVAEEYGGQGLGAVELAVLLEELGYACAATPLLSTATAASVIQRRAAVNSEPAGSPDWRVARLPPVSAATRLLPTQTMPR